MRTDPREGIIRAIVDGINVGIFTMDPAGVVLSWNRFMEINSGLHASDVVGKSLFELFPELPRPWLEHKMRSVLALGNFSFVSWRQRPHLFPFPNTRAVTGGLKHMRQDCTFFGVRGEDGGDDAICVAIFDATDTCMLQLELERLGQRDALTGVANRGWIERCLADEFNRFTRYGAPLSILLFDLDHFKRVNDRYGHLGGDEVLRVVASRVAGTIRDTDTLGRYGGEEFLVVLPSTNADEAMKAAERIRALIAASSLSFDRQSIATTVSIGVAEAAPTTSSYFELIQQADLALYACKSAGRNCVRSHSETVGAPVLRLASGDR